MVGSLRSGGHGSPANDFTVLGGSFSTYRCRHTVPPVSARANQLMIPAAFGGGHDAGSSATAVTSTEYFCQQSTLSGPRCTSATHLLTKGLNDLASVTVGTARMC